MIDEATGDGIVDARMFRLVGRDGRVRGVFGMDEHNDTPRMVLLESDGTVRVNIGLLDDGKGGASIWIHDHNGEPVAGFEVNADGRGVLNFYDAGGECLLGLGISADGAPNLNHRAAIGGTLALSDLDKPDETPDL